MFIFKKIAFVNNSKSAYLSAPKRDVVDLHCATAEAVHGLRQASAAQPCPTGMVGEKFHLRQEQRFDITALIKSISEIRPAGPGRTCFDAVLIDGITKEDADDMMFMKLEFKILKIISLFRFLWPMQLKAIIAIMA